MIMISTCRMSSKIPRASPIERWIVMSQLYIFYLRWKDLKEGNRTLAIDLEKTGNIVAMQEEDAKLTRAKKIARS